MEDDLTVLTVRKLISELEWFCAKFPGVDDLPVYDISDNPIHKVVFHDPNGDNTDCWMTVEPQ